ncbi:MAG: hypothetical protein JWM68_2638 [Verrucomicrobiales bacterium]|nr:hypothetical protein [Verrucomicrobiales bacterium]
MTNSARISYLIMAVILVLVGWLHMGMLVLTTLFGYFILRKLRFGRTRSKGFAAALYVIAIITLGYGLLFFTKQASIVLPQIAETSIPKLTEYAEQQKIDLPFTDYASLKAVAIAHVREEFSNVGRYAGVAFVQLAMLLIGLVVAFSLFLNSKWELEDEPNGIKDSMYSTVARELSLRFERFYTSFSTVIGAQIIISAINTAFTAGFILWNGFPYAMVMIGLTFLCGLLPIIGNVLSNSLIVVVGLTISPKMAIAALIFLIVIHKLEYFLNSKIIGDRIKNPMWLTLLGIVLGEKLMGIPGMILAPVVLYYIKVEASQRMMSDHPAPKPEQRPAAAVVN